MVALKAGLEPPIAVRTRSNEVLTVNFLKKGDGITNVELIGSASVVFQGSFDTDC